VNRAVVSGLIVAAAVVISAWLVFSIRANHLEARGAAAIEWARHGQVAPQDLSRALDQLRRSDRYNPDLTPLLDQAWLLYNSHRRQEALVLSLKAAAKEPENVQTWTLVYLTAPDRGVAARAAAKVKQLNPWLADSLLR
jgi:hypothetical protein